MLDKIDQWLEAPLIVLDGMETLLLVILITAAWFFLFIKKIDIKEK